MLQCVAVCCSVLQSSFLIASFARMTLGSIECPLLCCSVLQCAAVYCRVLQCVAVCYSVLQSSFLIVSLARMTFGSIECPLPCCSVLQCAAVCCSVLECVAVCCRVLPCVAVVIFYCKFCKNDIWQYRVFAAVLQAAAAQILFVYCSVLQCVALQHTATSLQHHCNITATPLQRTAAHYNTPTPQRNSANTFRCRLGDRCCPRCSVLQCEARSHKHLQRRKDYISNAFSRTDIHEDVMAAAMEERAHTLFAAALRLQHTATHCNTLQHAAIPLKDRRTSRCN